jgi:AraC-like DNA-binding protein
MQLLRCEEELPCVAYLRLTPGLVFVTFPACADRLPVWGGTSLRAGELMFHSPGERLHQRTPGHAGWSLIVLKPEQLEEYGKALIGKPLFRPAHGQVLRPSARNAARLRRLHAQACRLAETRPRMLAHPEVARAIEEGVIQVLVACLTARVREGGDSRCARILATLEEVVAEHLGRPLPMRDLCELVGVNKLTLRSCCAEVLGISPTRYALLRRLKQVRIALLDADPVSTGVAELAARYGFTQLRSFAGMYRAAFGETASTTLHRAPEHHFVGP